MFNNPLKKYQQGGQVSQEEQQILAAFVDWLPKRVKEFQGMQPEQIVEALNGMSKSPEGQKQVQAYMQQFQKEMQTSKAGMFRDGGKLHDFICKHKKGGVAGCGCKEDGGKVEKAEMGLGGLNDHSPRPAKVDVPLIPGILAELRQRKVANSGNAVNRNFSKANWKGNQYFLERADIGGNTADTWIQVTPDLDTLVQQQLPSGRYTPLTQEQAQSIVNRNRTDINKQEDGGVLKGQNSIPGGMPEPDPSVFGTLKQGKSRSAVSKAIDDNSKARHFVEGVKKFGNSTMVRLPATGLAAYAAFNVGSLPAVQSIGEVAPYLAKYVVFPALSQMRPKFLLNTMNPMGNVQNPTWHDTFWAVPSDNVMDKNNL